MSAQRRPPESFERDLAATAALAGYSLVVAMGFARVFSGWGFMTDLAAVVIVGHGSSFALRRARVSGWLAVPLTTMLLLWLVTALHYGDTLRWLLPSGETWHQIDLEIGLVRDKFQTEVAPVFYGAGWATLAASAVVIAVVMSDAFAFRAEARGEALVPGGVLFVFIAALGSPRLRIGLTALLLAAGVVAVIALRALHDRSRRVELTSARHPMSMVIPAALATAAAVAVLAGVVGPRIPGAQAEPLYETRGRGGGITEVVSPLVDIKSRLTNRGSTELFRVNADVSAYWRATTLPEFDGSQWRLPTRALERVDGAFGTVGGSDTRIRQQIQVLSLGGQLVPAAADPIEADGFSGGERLDLRVNRDTNTLLAPGEIQPGDLFTVVSSTPDLTPDRLRSVDTISPPDPIFIELPDDLPDVVARTGAPRSPPARPPSTTRRSHCRTGSAASSATASRCSRVTARMRSRASSANVWATASSSRGRYAAMARTLGIPSRVAVGFTPGVLNDEGWYSVLGKNAHAWPELWFDGIGWVAVRTDAGARCPWRRAVHQRPQRAGRLGSRPHGHRWRSRRRPQPDDPVDRRATAHHRCPPAAEHRRERVAGARPHTRHRHARFGHDVRWQHSVVRTHRNRRARRRRCDARHRATRAHSGGERSRADRARPGCVGPRESGRGDRRCEGTAVDDRPRMGFGNRHPAPGGGAADGFAGGGGRPGELLPTRHHRSRALRVVRRNPRARLRTVVGSDRPHRGRHAVDPATHQALLHRPALKSRRC